MESKSRRRPAGAAVLREGVTDAIRAAVVDELAAVGYGRMSIENIARRAGVGKAAIYRRWPSKLPIVLDVVSALALYGMPAPDTGTLLGDVRQLIGATARLLEHPLAAQIVPDLLAEAARNPEIAQAAHAAMRHTQRAVAAVVVGHAIERGELAGDTDVDLALDLAIGPLYWRLVMIRTERPAGYLDALAAATTAALSAARLS
ncbi:putative TetR family transcriptional regulator [Actinacidiphila reveromycinica]|uniref:Putative TetR family transcriptional regulator n=1 Tax=Actinacidiphila reveromycinica TaxID=659352 RepID=A0A7U3UR18_9ACTN|nr:TetR/AcrR family transcriptional regulator [Streptomyces sp. SN-593]BBA97098.1 putative TetR family transcriptional regulator [Streptomyces sp. SN-593]